ncbi:IS3 family transposase [Spirosoma flavum]|uniref:IS3 family transposase n=1 Tax=Spirosoma flavum TaxID=2048557 RepID=A0ABW6AKM6_9BACT
MTQIQHVYDSSQSRYGSPRIANDLNALGVKASRNRVARLMHKANIKSIMYKKYRVQTTDSKHDYPIANNLLNREFSAVKPCQKWVSDITARAAPLYPNWRRLVVPDCYFRFSR